MQVCVVVRIKLNFAGYFAGRDFAMQPTEIYMFQSMQVLGLYCTAKLFTSLQTMAGTK